MFCCVSVLLCFFWAAVWPKCAAEWLRAWAGVLVCLSVGCPVIWKPQAGRFQWRCFGNLGCAAAAGVTARAGKSEWRAGLGLSARGGERGLAEGEEELKEGCIKKEFFSVQYIYT